ncbi:MAG: polysaccharide biosynthesis tyrosine autokinase [Bacteroidales bacterium]
MNNYNNIRKIPVFNDSFDMSKLTHVIKKNILYYIIFGILTIIGTILYLRYTPPVYQAYSVIQINEEQNNNFMKIENIYGNTSITNLIELIRSREFLKRTLQKLNLYTSYYIEGKFLTSELYNKSPFFIETKNFPSAHKNSKLYIEYDDTGNYLLIKHENGTIIKDSITPNTWTDFFGGEIYINITHPKHFELEQSKQTNNKLYFTIYDENTAFREHFSGLRVSILSQQANTIKIYYSGNNAQKSSDIVNTISEDFLDYNIEKKQQRAENILSFIEEQLDIVYKRLDESEKKLQQFKKENNISGSIFQTKESTIASDFLQGSKEISKYQNQLSSLQKVNDKIDSGEDFNTIQLISILSGNNSQSMILNFLNGIRQLQEERKKLLLNVTEDNHKVKIIDEQIAEQKKLLQEFIEITNKRIHSEIEAYGNMQEDVDVNEFNEIELTKLKRIHSVHQNFYNQLISKRAEYMISKAGHVTNNLILQKSNTPNKPISPIKTDVIFIASILFLLAVLILTLIRYMLYNNIMSINDISKYTKVPITGVIPISKKSNTINRFIVENIPNSVITEAFRTLRSNLEFLEIENSSKKILAVTSTISGEGKTFIAINLGGVFALSGKRVIVLDLDLRKPKIHLTFNSSNRKGLSTILIGKNEYKDCIIKTEFENFDVITSGPPPPNPAELSNSQRFDDLLKILKEEYDIIIIDTPPIGIVSDAIYSFKRADLPIYITRANYSKRNFINNVNYLFEEKSIKNISIALNAVEIVTSKYGYGYKGYGYSNYGHGYGYGFGYGYYSYEDTYDEDNKNWFHTLIRKK